MFVLCHVLNNPKTVVLTIGAARTIPISSNSVSYSLATPLLSLSSPTKPSLSTSCHSFSLSPSSSSSSPSHSYSPSPSPIPSLSRPLLHSVMTSAEKRLIGKNWIMDIQATQCPKHSPIGHHLGVVPQFDHNMQCYAYYALLYIL